MKLSALDLNLTRTGLGGLAVLYGVAWDRVKEKAFYRGVVLSRTALCEVIPLRADIGGSHSEQVPAVGMDMHEYGLDVVSLCMHMGLSRFTRVSPTRCSRRFVLCL